MREKAKETVTEPRASNYHKPTCRGCYALGTACGSCERCIDERSRMSMADMVLTRKPDPHLLAFEVVPENWTGS
jgi:hypothetical protein